MSLKADSVAANNKLFYGLVYLDKSGLFVLVQNGFAVNMVVLEQIRRIHFTPL